MTTRPVILFDIDGTLVRGDGIGRRAMDAAFRAVLGQNDGDPVSLAAVPFHGNTDFAIVGEGLRHLGLEATGSRVAAILHHYLALVAAEVEQNNPFVALAGAVELVERLTRLAIPLGLGTGNIEPAAWLKVEAVGLRRHFGFGGFGSDHIDRHELLRVAWHRGAGALGIPPERCRVLVIGDTTRDIAAARAIGASVLAVATGGDPRATLEASAPDHLVESLTDPTLDTWLQDWLA